MKNILKIFLLFLLLSATTYAVNYSLASGSSTLSNRTLTYGLIRNPDVKTVQQILISKGYLVGTPTGNFLSVTKKAVQNFQKANNISPTGVVGPQTRTALLATKTTSTNPSTDSTSSQQASSGPSATTPAVTTPTVTDPNDHTPPVISNGTPSFTTLPSGTTTTTVSVTTNEPAICKYSNFYNPYNSMEYTFDTAPATTHSVTVSNLKDGKNYNYYVQCRDTSNNTTTSNYTIAFSIGGTYTPDSPVAIVPPVNAPTTPPVVPPVTPPVTPPSPPPYVPPPITGSPICEAVSPAHCYYVATNGDDTNPGTITLPFKTFKPAVMKVGPGDFVYARGGTYTSANQMQYLSTYNSILSTAMIAITDVWNGVLGPGYTVKTGTAGHPITFRNYPGETPVFTSGILLSSAITSKSYITIHGFEINGAGIYLDGGNGFGKETHDIIIENNYIHDMVLDTAGNNPGLIKIDRADHSGAYNIYIRNNHLKNASLTANPGVWHGVGHMFGGVTVMSIGAYTSVGAADGSTGYIEITNNEFEQLPAVVFFKNPMIGPIEMHGNIIHDSDMLGLLDASNMHFNHNLVYNVSSGFYEVGTIENTKPGIDAFTGQNAIVQNNTFVGLGGLMGISAGKGHNITNNIFFGLPDRVTGAGWDNGGGYLTQDSSNADPLDAVSVILNTIHSDNNCFITPYSDFIFVSRYYTDGHPLVFNNFATGKSLYGFDPNSKAVVQSDPTKIFTNPNAHDYTLLDPSICPSGAGVGSMPVNTAGVSMAKINTHLAVEKLDQATTQTANIIQPLISFGDAIISFWNSFYNFFQY